MMVSNHQRFWGVLHVRAAQYIPNPDKYSRVLVFMRRVGVISRWIVDDCVGVECVCLCLCVILFQQHLATLLHLQKPGNIVLLCHIRLVCHKAENMVVPAGSLLQHDCAPRQPRKTSATSLKLLQVCSNDMISADRTSLCPQHTHTHTQFNIERGYKLDAIIEELQHVDADILALQELDIDCERTNRRNTVQEIANALQMSYVFVSEFEELHSPVRAPALQGGGVHGNAILSRFPLMDATVVPHRCGVLQIHVSRGKSLLHTSTQQASYNAHRHCIHHHTIHSIIKTTKKLLCNMQTTRPGCISTAARRGQPFAMFPSNPAAACCIAHSNGYITQQSPLSP